MMLEAWSYAATGSPLPWPAPESLLLKFVAHHLWDPARRETDPEHGMPGDVGQRLRHRGFLRSLGPHASDTVCRRLSNWSTLTKWRGLDGAFASPALRSALRLAVRAVPRPRRRKSAKAITGDVLAKLLATCGDHSLRDIRDLAILMVAFASGGRRRSEVAVLRTEQLTIEAPVAGENGDPLPSLAIHLGRTKNSVANQDEVVYLTGRWTPSMHGWTPRLTAAACFGRSIAGAMFRAAPSIRRWSTISSSSGWRRPGSSRGATVGLSDRGCQPRHSPSRDHGAVSPSLDPAGIKLL